MAIEQLRRIGGVTYMDRGDGRLVPVSQGRASTEVQPPPRADAPMSVSTGPSYRFGDVGRGAGNDELSAAYDTLSNATNVGTYDPILAASRYAGSLGQAGLLGAIGAGKKVGGYAADALGAGYEALGGDRWATGGAAEAMYRDMGAGMQAAGVGPEARMLEVLSSAGAGRSAVDAADLTAREALAYARSVGEGDLAFLRGGGVPQSVGAGSVRQPNAAPFDMGRGIGDNGAPAISPYETLSMPAGSDPRYRGAAVDRSGGSFPRYAPKNTPARMQRLIDAADDPNSSLQSVFSQKVAKGQTLNGSDWYNTEELRDWFVSALGEEAGDAEWRDYITKIGATSTGSKVPANIRIGSFYRALGDDAPRVAELVNAKGITPVQAANELGINVSGLVNDGFGYGHLKQRGHAQNIMKQAAGDWEKQPPKGLIGAALTKWLQANPKVKGFTNSLLGDKKNIAADMHFMRLLAMSDGSPDFLAKQASLSADNLAALRQTYGDAIEPYITVRDVKGKPVTEVKLSKAAKDGIIQDTKMFSDMPSAWADVPDATEYAAYEQLAQRVAQQYGMTPAQFQANLWMGAGDLTNLADESQGTFMDLFRRALDAQAGRRGLNREQMLDDFIRNKAPLAVAPVGMGLLGAGMQGKDQSEM